MHTPNLIVNAPLAPVSQSYIGVPKAINAVIATFTHADSVDHLTKNVCVLKGPRDVICNVTKKMKIKTKEQNHASSVSK